MNQIKQLSVQPFIFIVFVKEGEDAPNKEETVNERGGDDRSGKLIFVCGMGKRMWIFSPSTLNHQPINIWLSPHPLDVSKLLCCYSVKILQWLSFFFPLGAWKVFHGLLNTHRHVVPKLYHVLCSVECKSKCLAGCSRCSIYKVNDDQDCQAMLLLLKLKLTNHVR